jgi:hypothetical protein
LETKRLVALVAALAITTAAVTVPAADAQAAPVSPQTIIANQAAIRAVIDPLLGGMDPRKLVQMPGYAGTVVDPVNDHFSLYWHGVAPAQISAALSHLPAGMTADIQQARHSRGRASGSGQRYH